MAEDDDADDAVSMALHGELLDKEEPRSGGFLQVKKEASARDSSMDAYMKESEDGLSAALGPRWDAKTLNENAEKSTQALLKGIGGGKTMQSLKGMMAALR